MLTRFRQKKHTNATFRIYNEKRNNITTSGFSLVELLVVVAILAILAAIAIPLFLNQRNKASQGAVQSDARNLATNLTTLFANLARGTNPIVQLNGDGASGATLTGSGSVGTPAGSFNVTLSPDVVVEKIGDSDPTIGSGLKLTTGSVDGWACFIPLPPNVAYGQTSAFQPNCGEVTNAEGNLLSLNVSTGTDALNSTAGLISSVNTVNMYPSTDFALSGTHSLKVVRNVTGPGGPSIGLLTGNNGFTGGGVIPVSPNVTYTAMLSQMSPTSTDALTVRINWWEADGITPAGPASVNTAVPASPNWTVVKTVATSPPDAAFASLYIRTPAGTAGNVAYYDNFAFWGSDSDVWQQTGLPMVN